MTEPGKMDPREGNAMGEERRQLSRRNFVGNAGAGFVGAVSSRAVGSPLLEEIAEGSQAGSGPLPRRLLGRTGLPVTLMCLGTAPCGIAPSISVDEVARIVEEAIDLGINFVDTSERYGNAEEGVGKVMARRREEVILATKVWADTIEEAEKKLAESLRKLRTDYADILYFHNLGQRDMKRALGSEGVFPWLLRQREKGVCRFVGISGHNLPARFLRFLDTGEVDVVLMTINFADRYTYNFEERVLPICREKNVGVVAMKVFGAPDPATGSWSNPKALPNVGLENIELAIRYALSLPGVHSANLGVHTLEQLRHNVEIVRNFRPLGPEDWARIEEIGPKLASKWGEHFGPREEGGAQST
jgi:predicted aldo/keto reductase-like oxidoreductase